MSSMILFPRRSLLMVSQIIQVHNSSICLVQQKKLKLAEKIPSVLANLVHIWTSNTSWNLLIIYVGQAFQDGLVHLSLKMDELIVEVSSIFTKDGRVHRPVQPR